MLNRWLDTERPAPPVVAVALAICAIAGFVGGGVLASIPPSGGSAEPDPSDTPSIPTAADVTEVSASCQRESGVDEAFNPVEYLPYFVLDGDTQTAWQCSGDGAGERLTFDFGEEVAVTELGVIPGYTKVDPTVGTDWYPLNRRLTEVRWHFDDGDPVDQTLDPDPDLRDLQTVALDEPRMTSTLVLEVVASELGEGNRNNIAVSEVSILLCGQC